MCEPVGVCCAEALAACVLLQVHEEVQLGAAELVFLLEDLWRKLDFSLAPAKKAPFLKVLTHHTATLILRKGTFHCI